MPPKSKRKGVSYERVTKRDLARLARIARADRKALFRRRPRTGKLYADRIFAVALCQGAARHYLDRKTGVKDFDVWSFYRAHPTRQFPPRRTGRSDFGNGKFGTAPDAPSHMIGRRVDLIGRSIRDSDYSNPVAVLRRYLRAGSTESARRLAEKAVILIEPARLIGTVVWPDG